MKKYWLLILIPLLLLVLLVVYGYSTSQSNALARSLKIVLPAFIIDGNTVSIAEWEEVLMIAKRLDPEVNHEVVLRELEKRIKERILAKTLKIDFNSDLAAEFNFQTKNRGGDYRDFLDQYFDGQEDLFINHVIMPQTVEAALQKRYNADFNVNAEYYNKAKQILEQAGSGENFDDLAKTESDDKLTGQFGGDLGFFADSELIPELENQIKNAAPGELIKDVVVSRYGYHVVYPVETAEPAGKKLWHAKHILVKTTGFEQWFENQTAGIGVKRLFNGE